MGDLPIPLRVLGHTEPADRAAPPPEPTQEQAPGVAGASTQPIPVVVLAGTQMRGWQQLAALAAHGGRATASRWRELRERDGGLVHGLLHARPPSVAEQCGYARDRAWLPAGHEGGIADMAGTVYHILIGRPGVAAGDLIAGICARPLRFAIACAVVLATAVPALIWFS